MSEPIVTTSGVVIRALYAVKDFPLWLLTGIALSLMTFVAAPGFEGAVSQEARTGIIAAAMATGIIALCRFGSLIVSQVKSYRAFVEAGCTFHLTPIPIRSFWEPARQKDGTIVSQIHAEFMAKNRTNKILHLLLARVVRPKLQGEVLHNFNLTEGDNNSTEGNSQFGICRLPPGATVRVTVWIVIRGVPGRRQKLPTLSAVLAMRDDEGNEQRVKLPLKAISSTTETR